MKYYVAPPKALGFWHPATLLATFGGAGLLRPAPGTIGAAAAAIIGWGLACLLSPLVLLPFAVLAFVAGIWAANEMERASGDKDPSSVVIDEVAGQWLVLAFVPLTAKGYLVAFALFRFFDILKPWPVSYADQKIAGGLGVMADDIIAGLYALLCTLVLAQVISLS
ncbi:MAG: phosphatidylglycerophosphatase A [Alphaproteobacteria bacterium]|nr:MAG: phosphatidylglycerophosphatase A [Alphaproteobacteria bacterium]